MHRLTLAIAFVLLAGCQVTTQTASQDAAKNSPATESSPAKTAPAFAFEEADIAMLQVKMRDGTLSLRPCPHPHWREYSLQFSFGNSVYQILVSRRTDSESATGLFLDGEAVAGDTVNLVDDGDNHRLKMVLNDL